MTNQYQLSSLEELENKSLNFRYQFIKKNYRELYKIFTNNVNKKEFKQSRKAAFILVLLPGFVNLYYVFINPASIFKTSFRIAAVFGCFLNFNNQLFTDLNDVGKTDTPTGNVIKKLWQNIAYSEPTAPDFGAETMQAVRMRKNKENNQENH